MPGPSWIQSCFGRKSRPPEAADFSGSLTGLNQKVGRKPFAADVHVVFEGSWPRPRDPGRLHVEYEHESNLHGVLMVWSQIRNERHGSQETMLRNGCNIFLQFCCSGAMAPSFHRL